MKGLWVARNNCKQGMDQSYIVCVNRPSKTYMEEVDEEGEVVLGIQFMDGGRKGIPNTPYIKDHRPQEFEQITGLLLKPGDGPYQLSLTTINIPPPASPLDDLVNQPEEESPTTGIVNPDAPFPDLSPEGT